MNPIEVPRYLAPFHPKDVPHFFADILVIGGGLAGLRTALAVDPSLTAIVITKDGMGQSNSMQAQGGIASVLGEGDSFEEHVADTLEAGGALCDREAVERVVRGGPARIQELIQWGTDFDRSGEKLALSREGGHGRERVAHALGDATGKEIMRAVIERVESAENIHVWQNTFTIDLLTFDGVCRGAIVWNHRHGKTLVWAKQTVLATGGTGQLYRETTNPDIATGDGPAMAYRAGAELRDMEFIQFHPTVLYIAGSSRFLISEAMRGEGAYLVDRKGQRFMPEYDDRAELAPRDVVSWSIVNQMERTRHPNVYLELTHLDPDWVRSRFPGIASICQKFGIDIAKDRIPVRPGAHYAMGGVTIDSQCRTTVPWLWAAGEATSSGLHGANRLASNSLLETLVHGVAAGQGASRAAKEVDDDFHVPPLSNPRVAPSGENLDLIDIRNSLKSLMWRDVGVQRDAEGLEDAVENIDRWSSYVLADQFFDPGGWELQNMLCVARLMIEGALRRKETRGCHVRLDFPEADEQWCRHTTFCRKKGE
jgi:L-aspartate oxidase